MKTEILGVIAQIVLMVALSYPLGKYIAKVYKKEKTWLDFMKPVERLMFRLSGINPEEEMNWKQFLRALLTVNLFWFVWGMVLLVSQGYLPLNPDGNVGQTCHQAFNTCISFMVNCNLQHYSGESGLTYFTQLFVIMLFQFITAATGMAAMAGIMNALSKKTTKTIGNFWDYLVLSSTRILLPLSLVVGFIAVGFAIVAGVLLGSIAGYYGDKAEELLHAVWAYGGEQIKKGVPCKPGLKELLSYLEDLGMPRIVASSSPRTMVELNLQTTGTARYFHDIVCGNEVKLCKPAPDIFLEAARRIKVDIHDCMVLEDSHNGIRAGHASGAETVMVPDLLPVTDEMRSLYDDCCKDLFEVKAKMEQGVL